MKEITIYVVNCAGGDISEYYWNNCRAFKLKYDATIYQTKADLIFKKLGKFYGDKLSDNNNLTDDEYWVYFHRMQQYNDKEFFISELKLQQ